MKLDTNKLRTSCLFCDPSDHGQADQILLRSDNFYVFAGLGAIIEGYLIITPYTCSAHGGPATTLAELPYDLLDELVFLRGMISAFYLEIYGHPGLSFEHGRAGGCAPSKDDTKHCYHPHLCCYPGVVKNGVGFQSDDGDAVYLWDRFALPNRRRCTGIHSIQSVGGTLPYLYIEHYDIGTGTGTSGMPSESRVFLAPEEQTLDSQFLRRQLANLVKDDEKWDWATFPTEDRVRSVSKAFGDWLQVHADDYAIAPLKQSVPSLHFETSVARLTARSYEKIGGKFKERWQGTLQYNTLGRFLSHIPAGPGSATERTIRLMDAGCGPGLYTRVFADLGFECVAVDPSKRMLQEAEKYLENNTRGNAVTLIQARLEELDSVVWGNFDAVWLSAVLLHIPRKTAGQVLHILSELLNQDGVLYLSTRLLCDEAGHDLPAFETRREGRVFVYYQESELEDLFARASLQIVMSWKGMTTIGTLGEKQNKPWRHYLLTKSRLSED
jgi:2-polyprenyl-3-methyl-5-hydroxy-6-metoxy-1,4-benzoquinol methylase